MRSVIEVWGLGFDKPLEYNYLLIFCLLQGSDDDFTAISLHGVVLAHSGEETTDLLFEFAQACREVATDLATTDLQPADVLLYLSFLHDTANLNMQERLSIQHRVHLQYPEPCLPC